MKTKTSDEFMMWKLKEEFDDAIITESDIEYYRKMNNIASWTTIFVQKSDGSIRDVYWPQRTQ